MNKTFTIIKKEYIQRVKTKGFLIGTLLMPVFMLAVTVLPSLFISMDTESKSSITVVDFTNKLYPSFSNHLMDAKKDKEGQSLYVVNQLELTQETFENEKSKLDEQVENGSIQSYIVIPEDVFEANSFKLYTKSITNFDFFSRVENALSAAVINIRMTESGLDNELIKKLSKNVYAQTFQVDKSGSKEANGIAAFGMSYFLVFILYMALILYGTFVMRGVIEDKNSRVVEVVLSSVKPHQLMAGKIIGIAATGLTQFFVWILTIVFVSTYGLAMAKQFAPGMSEIPIPDYSFWIYGAFIIYFLLGYFLYATLYAGLGSMVNSDSEAQNVQWPVMILIIASFMLMFAIMKTPDSTLAVVLSLIPFFTPLLMFFRIMLNAAPLYQIILSIVITGLTIVGSIWISGKIFRVGILMYGKRPNLPELLKWIKY